LLYSLIHSLADFRALRLVHFLLLDNGSRDVFRVTTGANVKKVDFAIDIELRSQRAVGDQLEEMSVSAKRKLKNQNRKILTWHSLSNQ
jgi:hypothetical protein